MGYLSDVAEHKTDFLKGLTYLVAGFALILIGTIIGYGTGKAAAIAAGTLATTGIVIAFVGFFVHIVPPLLPAK